MARLHYVVLGFVAVVTAAVATHGATDALTTNTRALREFNPQPANGWRAIDVREVDMDRFHKLKNESNYHAAVTLRVCIYAFDYLYEQNLTVGANYQYRSFSCEVDRALDSGVCARPLVTYEKCVLRDIRVFECTSATQNVTQVLRIANEDGPPKDTNDVIHVKSCDSALDALQRAGNRSSHSGSNASTALPQQQQQNSNRSSAASTTSAANLVVAVGCYILSMCLTAPLVSA